MEECGQEGISLYSRGVFGPAQVTYDLPMCLCWGRVHGGIGMRCLESYRHIELQDGQIMPMCGDGFRLRLLLNKHRLQGLQCCIAGDRPQ